MTKSKLEPLPIMTADEFRAAVDLLFGGSTEALSRFLDHAPGSKAVRRWAGGDVEVSKCVTILLRMMIHSEVTPVAIRALAMHPGPQRGPSKPR
jgi:hypothetical protein